MTCTDPVLAPRIRTLLQAVPFLNGIEDALMDQVITACNWRTLKQGHVLFNQGDPGDALYIVVSGQVSIYKHDPITGQDHLLDVNFPGDVFGELALVAEVTRAGRAVITSPKAEVLVLPRNPIEELIYSSPQRSRDIVGLITKRLIGQDGELVRQLRLSNQQLTEANLRLEEAYSQLDSAYTATLVALNRALDLRDQTTQFHTERVVAFSNLLALAYGLPPRDQVMLQRGALLHDVGKIGVPDAILRKSGPLNDDEWELMRLHPIWGEQIVSEIPFLDQAAVIVRQHHERWDGSGYPDQLSGARIHIGARLFALADVFDALVSPRPYKAAFSPETARELILAERGTHFDPQIVDVFQQVYPQFVYILNTKFPVREPGLLPP